LLKPAYCFSFIILLAIPLFSQGQENPLPWDPPVPVYDTPPRFPGGAEALLKFFADSIHYPEYEKSKKIHGNVIVKFTVTKKGALTNIRIVNGVAGGPNLATETIRLLKGMPRWLPATKGRRRVEAEHWLSVPFRL
jgi:TonB family protein